MQQYKGKPVSNGSAFGVAYFYDKRKAFAESEEIEDADNEIGRFRGARKKVLKQLEAVYEKAVREAGEEDASIFKAYMMILSDEEYGSCVEKLIEDERINAENAVKKAGEQLAGTLACDEDDIFSSRSTDIEDLSEHLIRVLTNDLSCLKLEEPVILITDELTPSEIVQLDKDKVFAVVTRHGSVNSHAAILARAMGLPMVTGIDTDLSWDKKTVAVDADRGIVTIDPDEDVLRELLETDTAGSEDIPDASGVVLSEGLRSKSVQDSKGRRLRIYANIDGLRDVDDALKNGAEGIGLFRTEYLYMRSSKLPSEEEQFEEYKAVAQKMGGKPVVIRTADLGADKTPGYIDLPRQENPALGIRGIRFSLKRPDIFRTQLRAILRASAFGNISVMFPMITSLEEVIQSKIIIEEVKEQLKLEGEAYDEKLKTGVMIETPAAALISEELAREADFFSIGTNDLTQYTVAADREDPAVSDYCYPHHAAVLELIRLTAQNAHKAGISVAICGELAADIALTGFFADCGIDELSVSPHNIFSVSKYM